MKVTALELRNRLGQILDRLDDKARPALEAMKRAHKKGNKYVGRVLELIGLFLVTAAMFLFFGSSEMRPMLAVTGVGAFLFFVGWVLARKNPGAR